MAGYPRLDDNYLYIVAAHLVQPKSRTEIHAEMPFSHRVQFELEYAKTTNSYPLPACVTKAPYYVWPEGTNKRGRQLRIYFAHDVSQPLYVTNLCTDFGKWRAKRSSFRINHSKLVMQLFECGFVLGADQDQKRISSFMNRRFPIGRL